MTPEERTAARAAHAAALANSGRANTGLETARANHAAAVIARAVLTERAAEGSNIPASKLVDATSKIAECASAVEIATGIAAAAQERETSTAGLLREANEADRVDHIAAALKRRLAAAEVYDKAITEAVAALSEMEATREDILQNGGPPCNFYVLKNAPANVADAERRLHFQTSAARQAEWEQTPDGIAHRRAEAGRVQRNRGSITEENRRIVRC